MDLTPNREVHEATEEPSQLALAAGAAPGVSRGGVEEVNGWLDGIGVKKGGNRPLTVHALFDVAKGSERVEKGLRAKEVLELLPFPQEDGLGVRPLKEVSGG